MNICTLCGRDMKRRSVSGFRFGCCRCGFAALEDQGRSDRYWDGRDGEQVGHVWADSLEQVFGAVLTELTGRTSKRRLIDFGGGIGHFCQMAFERGWDAHNVEISSYARREAEKKLTPSHVHQSLDGLEPADVITMWCVLSHTPDPQKMLSDVRGALNPGGHLFMTAPNWTMQRLTARAVSTAGGSINFSRQDHIAMFSRRTLKRLLADSGFTNIEFGAWGVKQRCVALGGSTAPGLLAAKKNWNRLWTKTGKFTGLDLTSEFQVFATRD